jgi:hypothetical protein
LLVQTLVKIQHGDGTLPLGYSLQHTTGTNNTAIGQAALYLNTTGGYNTALGTLH